MFAEGAFTYYVFTKGREGSLPNDHVSVILLQHILTVLSMYNHDHGDVEKCIYIILQYTLYREGLPS